VWTPFDGLPALPKVHFPNRDYTFSDPSPFNLSLSSELVRITGACPICEWHWLAARANPLHLSPFLPFFVFHYRLVQYCLYVAAISSPDNLDVASLCLQMRVSARSVSDWGIVPVLGEVLVLWLCADILANFG
jgi:hypothetical protein